MPKANTPTANRETVADRARDMAARIEALHETVRKSFTGGRSVTIEFRKSNVNEHYPNGDGSLDARMSDRSLS
jgi:hypothetical protein